MRHRDMIQFTEGLGVTNACGVIYRRADIPIPPGKVAEIYRSNHCMLHTIVFIDHPFSLVYATDVKLGTFFTSYGLALCVGQYYCSRLGSVNLNHLRTTRQNSTTLISTRET